MTPVVIPVYVRLARMCAVALPVTTALMGVIGLPAHGLAADPSATPSVHSRGGPPERPATGSVATLRTSRPPRPR